MFEPGLDVAQTNSFPSNSGSATRSGSSLNRSPKEQCVIERASNLAFTRHNDHSSFANAIYVITSRGRDQLHVLRAPFSGFGLHPSCAAGSFHSPTEVPLFGSEVKLESKS